MNVWKKLCAFVIAVCYLPVVMASVQSPVGIWTTVDEKTGEKRAIVDLKISNGTLNGTITKIFHQAGDTGICSKCPGAFKDKKIEGIEFVWGLKDQGEGVWNEGSILDPKTGKIYKAKMTLEGNKLYVRGYIGVSLLGRTQTWVR
ncbi:MAG: DUF2147 domain-containing protein [Legionellales bacterium]